MLNFFPMFVGDISFFLNCSTKLSKQCQYAKDLEILVVILKSFQNLEILGLTRTGLNIDVHNIDISYESIVAPAAYQIITQLLISVQLSERAGAFCFCSSLT